MSAKTGIEWCSATWNPIIGCRAVQPACKYCYAVNQVHRLAGHPNPKIASANKDLTLVVNGHLAWTGHARYLHERLKQPLHWRQPRRIFVNSLSDLFHEDITHQQILEIFSIMEAASWHTFIVLTKRPQRMYEEVKAHADWMDYAGGAGTYATRFSHVQWGISAGTQHDLEASHLWLAKTPAAIRIWSLEPLLEAIDIQGCTTYCPEHDFSGGFCIGPCPSRHSTVDQILIGGESGRDARPCNIAWIRNLVQQCVKSRIAPFVKQVGAKPFHNTSAGHHFFELHDRKGGDPAEWPEDIRIREYPGVVHA